MAHWSPEESFETLKNRVAETVKSYFPIQGKKQTLVATKVWVDDDQHMDDIRSQQDAKLKKRSWTVPVRAEFSLIDNETGKVKDRQALTVAQLPKITRRYNYIVNGNEWQVANQFRLKSGAYTRIKANGEFETQWNLAKGLGFHTSFDPASKMMSIEVGNAKVPLYPVLKTLGVADDDIEKHWGKQILSANMQVNHDVALKKLFKAYTGEQPETVQEAQSFLRKTYDATELRPDSTKLTLGKPFTKVTGDALLTGSQKILRVSRQEEDPDDRDSLEFKDILSAEDLLAERLHKVARRDVVRKIANTVDKHQAVRNIVNPDFIGKPIRRFFTSSTLADRPTDINPVSFLVGHRQTTGMGEGGLSSDRVVSPDARGISGSHIGFLDPIVTPESSSIGVTLQLASGVKKDGKTLVTRMYDTKQKKLVWVDPGTALKANVAFPDQFTWKDGKPSPVGKTVKVSDRKGQISPVDATEVDYILTSTKGMFDLVSNMIPFLQSDQGNRTMVAAKQISQAVPLKYREAPLVQTRGEASGTFEQAIGKFNSHAAPADGTVIAVRKDAVLIRDAQNKRHEVQLYDDFPLNDPKSVLTSEVRVKVGDAVKKGQIVADTNFTDNGVLALGKNLKVAYMPYRGYNFEDAVVVSESAAKAMTSQHMLRETVTAEANSILNKKKFLAETAGTTSKEQADKLDDDAVIRVGQKVRPGDVLIGLMRKEEVTPESSQLALISKKLVKPVRTRAVTWDKDYEGVVAKVVKHGKDTTVYVKTETPLTVGDKLVGRHGNKGICSLIVPDHEMPKTSDGKAVDVILSPAGLPCYDEETEFLTLRGWVLGRNLSMEDTFATINPKTLFLEYQTPSEVYKIPYEGPMYAIQNQQIDLLVTPHHKMLTAPLTEETRNAELDNPKFAEAFSLQEAREIEGQRRRYLKVARWVGTEPFFFYVPAGTETHPKGKTKHGVNVPSRDWAEFMGWFLSEGSTYTKKGSQYVTEISQYQSVNPENCIKIRELLTRIGFQFHQTKKGFRIIHKGLWETLKPLGNSFTKFIPREILDLPTPHLKRFLDAYVAGDGNECWDETTGHYGNIRVWTTSPQLAGGLQEIACKLGLSLNVKEDQGPTRLKKYKNGTCYHLAISGTRGAPWVNWSETTKSNQTETWVPYQGHVYCATVPNATLFVRRAGKAVFSGNTRINLGQALETAASKIARKTGKSYQVNNFDPNNKDYTRNLLEELKSHGLKDTEDLVDPKTGKTYKDVLVGDQYMLKLHHTADKKLLARSRDAYDSNMIPKGGGDHSGQSMEAYSLYALLAHNARENLREMQSYKSDLNETFWSQLQAGEALSPPKIPFAYKKFEGYLKGMGVDVQKEGNQLILAPMTDAQITSRTFSNGEIRDPTKMIRGKDNRPEVGGLFDPKITGTAWPQGKLGDKWSHITLAERMPNPVFSKAVTSLLGLKEASIPKILGGHETLHDKTGPEAIVSALKNINVESELKKLESTVQNLKGQRLDATNKRIKYLRALKQSGLRPDEAYTLKHVPVIPPVMRPISVQDNGDLRYNDINGLYKNLGATNHQLKTFDESLPPEEKSDLRKELYAGLQGLMLTGAPSHEKFLNGIMKTISGKVAKEGFFQSKVIGKRQDLSMRGVIVPEPSLSLDQVGLPRKAAMEIYKPFVVQRLRRNEITPLQAQEMIRKNDPMALKALELEVEERPVLLKRDPVLHRGSLQAFYPKLMDGKTIKIHPLVTGPFNADFDGDQQIGSVYLFVEHGVSLNHREWWLHRKVSDEMAARFRTVVGYLGEGDFYTCNLEDFPHEGLLHSKDHIDFYAVPAGIQVVSWDNLSGKFVVAPVSCWSVHHNRQVELVTLRSGRQVITDHDPRAVYGIDENLEEVRRTPEDAVKCLTYVPTVHQVDVDGEEVTHLPVQEEGHRVRPFVELSLGFGRLIGTLVGDGWVVTSGGELRGAVALAAAEDSVRAGYEKDLLTVFYETPTITATERIGGDFGESVVSRKYVVTSVAYSALVAPLIGQKAEFKHLPPCFLQTPKEFKVGLLAGLFDTDGSISISHGKDVPQWQLSYSSRSIRLVQEVQFLARALGVGSTITESTTPKGKAHWVLSFSTVDFHKLQELPVNHMGKAQLFMQFFEDDAPDEKGAYARYDIIPTPPSFAKILRDAIGTSLGQSTYVVLTNAMQRGYLSRYSAAIISKALPGLQLENPLLKKWLSLVHNTSVRWDMVKSYQRTESFETGYDLTVPGYETFMSVDGVVLSNTMAAFVPVSKKAMDEARRMTPSHNLFSPTTGRVVFRPEHEATLGLYKLTEVGKDKGLKFSDAATAAKAVRDGKLGYTDLISLDSVKGIAEHLTKMGAAAKTTVGRLLVYHSLPEALRDPKMLHDPGYKFSKEQMGSFLTRIAKEKPLEFAGVADSLKNLGNEYATGMSFGLHDLVSDKDVRDPIMRKAQAEELKVRHKDLPDDQRDKEIVKIYMGASKELDAAAKAKYEKSDNRMYDWVRSGARGKWSQFKQMTLSPVLVSDSHSQPVPSPITKSYSEGLDIGSYWNSMHGARMGTYARVRGTEEPGTMSKDMMSVAIDQLVTGNDCGTKSGIVLDVDDRDVLDRYTVHDIQLETSKGQHKGVVPAGTLITSDVVSRLKNNKITSVAVRSPLKCRHGKGICAKCFGLSEKGDLHTPGTNVGVMAVHALGEPATQLSMNAFHEGGVVGGKGSGAVDKFTRIKQLTELPGALPDVATIASTDGKVESVTKDPAGGWNVMVGGVRHFVPSRRELKAKVGDTFKKGDSLSSGVKNPVELLKVTQDLGKVQKYISDELWDAYKDEGPVKRRNIEVFVRAMTNLGHVTDPGDHPEYIKGDYVPLAEVNHWNSKIPAKTKAVQATPVLKSVKVLPRELQTDWLALMNTKRLKQTLLEAVPQGWRSNLHGNHPIPGLAVAKEFGTGTPEEPWAY